MQPVIVLVAAAGLETVAVAVVASASIPAAAVAGGAFGLPRKRHERRLDRRRLSQDLVVLAKFIPGLAESHAYRPLGFPGHALHQGHLAVQACQFVPCTVAALLYGHSVRSGPGGSP